MLNGTVIRDEDGIIGTVVGDKPVEVEEGVWVVKAEFPGIAGDETVLWVREIDVEIVSAPIPIKAARFATEARSTGHKAVESGTDEIGAVTVLGTGLLLEIVYRGNRFSASESWATVDGGKKKRIRNLVAAWKLMG